MIRKERPGVANSLCLRKENGASVSEIFAIPVVREDRLFVYSPDNDVVKRA